MIKLINIELRKILSKKSIFVIMIIMLLFNILNNVLFYIDYDSDGNYKNLEKEDLSIQKEIIEEEIRQYDKNKESDIAIYVNLKTKLDLINQKEKYSKKTWQYHKIDEYLYNTLEYINIYTYQINDDKLLQKYKTKLIELLKKLDSDDWQYFINLEITQLKEENIELENKLTILKDKKELQNIRELLEVNKLDLYILEYRIKNNIKEDNNYLDKALREYKNSSINLKKYNNVKKLNLKEKKDYQKLKQIKEENKYILDNKINYNKQNNLNYQLRTIVDDYEILIILMILIIASTSVAEEFQTGTIKLLLIKPYSRGKILLSKYLAVVVILLFTIIYLIAIQLIIGGIFFGISSLKIPVIIYNFTKENIIEYNVFLYMLIRIITKLPLLIMLLTISFSLSTFINNIAISISIPLLIYIFTPSIIQLIMQYNINILKYLININWNFNDYLFGNLSEIKGLNFKFSIIIWSIYYLAITIFTYLNFKKKNIRNI